MLLASLALPSSQILVGVQCSDMSGPVRDLVEGITICLYAPLAMFHWVHFRIRVREFVALLPILLALRIRSTQVYLGNMLRNVVLFRSHQQESVL